MTPDETAALMRRGMDLMRESMDKIAALEAKVAELTAANDLLRTKWADENHRAENAETKIAELMTHGPYARVKEVYQQKLRVPSPRPTPGSWRCSGCGHIMSRGAIHCCPGR
jgi:rubrerythrin